MPEVTIARLPTIIGQNFAMGAVSVRSRYDRIQKLGYLHLGIEADSTPDQRLSVAQLIREFADELKH